MEKKALNQNIEAELFGETLDLVENYAELGIDSFLSDGLLKDIPVIGTLHSIYRIGSSIQDAIFLRNLVVFLASVQKRMASDDNRKKFREKFQRSKNKDSFIEKTLFCLTKSEETWKSLLYGNSFLSLCSDRLSFDEYGFIVEYIANARKFELELLKRLVRLPEEEGTSVLKLQVSSVPEDVVNAGLRNLMNNGLITDHGTIYYGRSDKMEMKYSVTKFGEKVFSELEFAKVVGT